MYQFKGRFPNPREDIDGFLRELRDIIKLYDPLPADQEKLLQTVTDPIDFAKIMSTARTQVAGRIPWPAEIPNPNEEINLGIRAQVEGSQNTIVQVVTQSFPKKVAWDKVHIIKQEENEPPRVFYGRLEAAIRQNTTLDLTNPAETPQILPGSWGGFCQT